MYFIYVFYICILILNPSCVISKNKTYNKWSMTLASNCQIASNQLDQLGKKKKKRLCQKTTVLSGIKTN